MKILLYTLAFGFLTFTQPTTNWEIKSGYQIKFDGGKVKGTFHGLQGDISFDENDLTHSKIEVVVDVTTINTGKSVMNEHAKNESWFNANKYPNITFKSLEIKKLNNGFSVLGELNMHGVKKALSFPFRYKQTDSGASFEGQFKVNRKDFGINGNAFGFMVGDLYTVDLAIPVKKKK